MAPPNLKEVVKQIVCEFVLDYNILKKTQKTEQIDDIVEKIEETRLTTLLLVMPDKLY